MWSLRGRKPKRRVCGLCACVCMCVCHMCTCMISTFVWQCGHAYACVVVCMHVVCVYGETVCVCMCVVYVYVKDLLTVTSKLYSVTVLESDSFEVAAPSLGEKWGRVGEMQHLSLPLIHWCPPGAKAPNGCGRVREKMSFPLGTLQRTEMQHLPAWSPGSNRVCERFCQSSLTSSLLTIELRHIQGTAGFKSQLCY